MATGGGCSLLPGIYGLVMQGLLFGCACAVLVCKQVAETPRRLWLSFLLDASKQLTGAGWIHVLNMLFAVQLHRFLNAGDECLWYWLHIVVDTTLGVAVEYALLELLSACLRRGLGDAAAEEFQGGHYYEDVHGGASMFRWRRYGKQLALWLSVVTLMKLIVVAFLLALRHPLVFIAGAALSPLDQNPMSKLAVVMIATPLCMNALQFWLVDGFLKQQEVGGGGAEMLRRDAAWTTEL